MRRRNILAAVLSGLVLPFALNAASNVSEANALTWGANVGWIHWRPDPAHGAAIGQFVCSGFIHGANIGWIHLGNGLPANGIHYSNTQPDDYGVNVDESGGLRGYAYGANVGWIAFEDQGNPRIDLATGEILGSIHGANIGWISLSDTTLHLSIDHFSPGLDSDGDGIPDAWELKYAGNLTTLSRTGDADGDGVSDYEEYLADTNPLDPDDYLAILNFEPGPDGLSSMVEWRSRPTRTYRLEFTTALGEAWEVSDIILPEGATTSVTLSHPEQPSALFLRIRVLPPLVPEEP